MNPIAVVLITFVGLVAMELEECQPTCGENEIIDSCPAYSSSDYCPIFEDNKAAPTPDPCPPPACKCVFNYRRAVNGTCIPTVDCPPFDCYKPNEVYTPCPPICPSDECSKARVTGICPYEIGIVLECNPKCQCKTGYGRCDGVCVPFNKCPNLCPVNEEYTTCIQTVCRPQTCMARRGPVIFCTAVDKKTCKGGCVCKASYYRNEKGTCVTNNEC